MSELAKKSISISLDWTPHIHPIFKVSRPFP
jgi:hypothetical protein